MDFRKDHIIHRTGASQADRFPAALRKDFIGIDERDFLELVRQAAEYARHLSFYDDSNVPSGDWKEMFSPIYDYDRGAVREDALDQLMSSSQTPPHLALLLSFLKMFRIEQGQLNGIVDKSLSFYYKDVLGFSPKKGSSGSVPLAGTLSKNATAVFIPEGTKFVAGKDADGREIHYQNNYDVTLNNASIKDKKSYRDYKDYKCAFTFGSPVLEKKTGDSYIFPYLETIVGRKDDILADLSFMESLRSFEGTKVEYTSTDGWVQVQIEKTADQLRDEVKKMAGEYEYCLHIEKVISAYNPEVHGAGYSGNMPLIRIVSDYFNYMPAKRRFTQKRKSRLRLEMVVFDTEDFILENPEGVMQNKRGECFFGSMARRGSEFTIRFPHPFTGDPSLENVPDVSSKEYERKDSGPGIISYKLITDKYDQRILSNNYALGLKTLSEYEGISTSGVNLRARTFSDPVLHPTEISAESLRFSVSLTEGMTVNIDAVRNAIKTVEDKLKGKTNLTVEESDEISKSINDIIGQMKNVGKDLDTYKDSLAEDRKEIEDEVKRLKGVLEELAAQKQNELDKTLESVKEVLASIQGEITKGNGLVAIVPELKEPVKVKCVRYSASVTDTYYTNPFLTFRVDGLDGFERFNVSGTSLYLGLTGLDLGENILNLYFRMKYKSAVPEHTLSWEFFDGKSWNPGRPFLRDSTLELRRNGVISLAVSTDGDNQVNRSMPEGCFWLRLNSNEVSLDAIDEIVCQAFEVEQSPDSPGKAPVGTALPAGTIKKPMSSIIGLKKVTQQFDGNEGAFDETEEQFFCRVSERLRHKDRAWNSWDYEHIVLEHFPKVSAVKCVPLHDGDGCFAPGHVSVMVVPTSDVSQDNPLCPYVGGQLSAEIKEYLKERISGQVELDIVDPVYVRATVSCEVVLREGYDDKSVYENEINEALKAFLSPWTGRVAQSVNIYDRNETDVLFFLENIPCVDYVKSLVITIDGKVVNEGERLAPKGVFKVVASADEHIVNVVDE